MVHPFSCGTTNKNIYFGNVESQQVNIIAVGCTLLYDYCIFASTISCAKTKITIKNCCALFHVVVYLQKDLKKKAEYERKSIRTVDRNQR